MHFCAGLARGRRGALPRRAGLCKLVRGLSPNPMRGRRRDLDCGSETVVRP
jgi:hypothetical protein